VTTLRDSLRARNLRQIVVDPYGLFAALLTVAVVILIVGPLASAIVRAFTTGGVLDLAPLQKVLVDPEFHTAAKNTGIIVVVAGTFAMALGSTFAWLNERTDARMGMFSTVLPLVPLLLPPIALSIGWIFLGHPRAGFVNGALQYLLPFPSETGPLNIGSWAGVIFVYTISLMPYAYLVVSASLRNMDTSLEEASRMSGGGRFRTLSRVSLPLVRPALASAALLMLIIGTALFSIPRTIGSLARIDVISVYIVRLTQTFPSRLDEAMAVSLVKLVVIGGAWVLHQRLTTRRRFLTISGKGQGSTLVELGTWRWVARAMMIGFILLVSVLPLTALIIVSLQPFWTAAIDPSLLTFDHFRDILFSTVSRPRAALGNSLRLGVISATLTMFTVAVMVSYAMDRGGILGRSVGLITKSPGAISHLVIGVALILSLGGPPLRLGGTGLILLIAYVIMYMPQASISAEVARGQVGGDLLEASAMLGASRGRTFRKILLPLMLPGLAAGWALVFILTAGDLTASAILSGSSNPVIGAVILEIWEFGTFAQLAALAVLVSTISAITVTTVLSLRRRRRARALVRDTTVPALSE